MIASATNPTSPTAGASSASGASSTPLSNAANPGGNLGKDAFLKLLVAQMKNQDPMNPMQGDQMAAQLAQFSSVEQLTQINQTLTGQHTDQNTLLSAIQMSAGMNAIGKTVIATGNQLVVGPDSPPMVAAKVSGVGGHATLTIYDTSGKAVATNDLGIVNGGEQTFAIGSMTKNLPAGNYTYGIDVKDAAGKPVDVTTYTSGKIDGVQSTPNGVVLSAGPMSIPYSSIVQILQ